MNGYAAQQAAAEVDPFEQMMQAEFGAEFSRIGSPALEGNVDFTPEEIDAQVADFAAEMNRMEATAESENVELSAIDRAVLGDRISMRTMTESELALVALNEERARRATAGFQEFAFLQMTQGQDKKDEAND